MSDKTTTDALRLVPRRAVYDWIRDDVPLNVKMTIMPHHIDALMDRLSKAAPASPLPGGGWRTDFENAPKDGTPFVGLKGRLAFRTTWQEYYVKWPHEKGGPTFRGQWTYEDSSAHCPWNPTHWMPLPAAPTGEPK